MTGPATTANGQIVPRATNVANLQAFLERPEARTAIKKALPAQIGLERFIRIALTSLRRNTALQACTPESFASALLQAAALGLEVDSALGHAYLVPFKDNRRNTTECTLIVGYKGLVQLAYRSGRVLAVEAAVVREGDDFSYRKGTSEFLNHTPKGDPKALITHAYAIITVHSGGLREKLFDVMTVAEINTIQERSRAGDQGPWKTDRAAMSMKTVLRRVTKLGPASVETSRAIALDEEADAGLIQTWDVNLGDLPDEDPGDEAPAPAALEAAGASEPEERRGDPEDVPGASPRWPNVGALLSHLREVRPMSTAKDLCTLMGVEAVGDIIDLDAAYEKAREAWGLDASQPQA